VLNGGDLLRLNAGLFAGARTINQMPGADENEHFKVLNARDENGQLTGRLAVQWLDMRQDFTVNPGATIVARMRNGNDSVALEADVTNALHASGGDGRDVLIGALGNDSLEGNDATTGCSAMRATTRSSAAPTTTCSTAARARTCSMAGRAATR
jgi:Ca2+-binding RTX toxin-like protein